MYDVGDEPARDFEAGYLLQAEESSTVRSLLVHQSADVYCDVL